MISLNNLLQIRCKINLKQIKILFKRTLHSQLNKINFFKQIQGYHSSKIYATQINSQNNIKLAIIITFKILIHNKIFNYHFLIKINLMGIFKMNKLNNLCNNNKFKIIFQMTN